MTSILLSACVLAFLTMAVHATGIAALLRGLMRSHLLRPKGVLPVSRLLLRMIWWLILLHLAEMAIWGVFYLWRGLVPTAETAFYFSGVTYTTLGHGDLVLARPWRLLAPIEGLMGVLMCGLSTGYFFLILSRCISRIPQQLTSLPHLKSEFCKF